MEGGNTIRKKEKKNEEAREGRGDRREERRRERGREEGVLTMHFVVMFVTASKNLFCVFPTFFLSLKKVRRRFVNTERWR
jgi:hypothetical protein